MRVISPIWVAVRVARQPLPSWDWSLGGHTYGPPGNGSPQPQRSTGQDYTPPTMSEDALAWMRTELPRLRVRRCARWAGFLSMRAHSHTFAGLSGVYRTRC